MTEPIPLYGPDTLDAEEIREYIANNRSELRQGWKEKQSTLEKLLVVMKNGLDEAKHQKLPQIEVIWNAAAYITLISSDLAVLGELQMFEESEWKRRYHARNAALLIFEALSDLSDVLGHEFRKAVKVLPTGEDLLREVNAAQKALSKIRNRHDSELKNIRDFAAAHRDNSAANQLGVVFDLQPAKIFRLSADFDSALNILGTASQACMTISSDSLHLYKNT